MERFQTRIWSQRSCSQRVSEEPDRTACVAEMAHACMGLAVKLEDPSHMPTRRFSRPRPRIWVFCGRWQGSMIAALTVIHGDSGQQMDRMPKAT
jgi:hypothetical protein